MISIRTSVDLSATLDAALCPHLRRVLVERRDQLLADGFDLTELAHIIVVQRGDTLDAIEGEAGVALSTNLVTGARLGDRDFTPNFEFVERHLGCWLEAVLILSDDGFGVVLFVPDVIHTDPQLLRLLAA